MVSSHWLRHGGHSTTATDSSPLEVLFTSLVTPPHWGQEQGRTYGLGMFKADCCRL